MNRTSIFIFAIRAIGNTVTQLNFTNFDMWIVVTAHDIIGTTFAMAINWMINSGEFFFMDVLFGS